MTDKLDKVKEAIACLTCNVGFACGYKFSEVGAACKEQMKLANSIFYYPVEVKPEKPCPECKGTKTIYLQLPDDVGSINEIPCPTCKGAGRLPARVKTIGEILEEAIDGIVQ